MIIVDDKLPAYYEICTKGFCQCTCHRNELAQNKQNDHTGSFELYNFKIW